MTTPDGARRLARGQHQAQVTAVAEAVGALDVLDIVDSELVTESWLKEAEKTYSPNTVVTYLLSLGHFTDFLLTKNCVKYFELTNGEQTDIRYFRDQLPRWRKSYAKDRQKRHYSNMADFIANPLVPADVEKYERSSACKEAVKLLSTLMEARSFQGTRKIDTSTFTKIRDYLICKTIIRNAQRSGALSNMTCAEWCNGKPSKENPEGVSVMVSKSKTGHKHPLVLDFDSHLKGAMGFFFKNIRHQYAKTNAANLFFTSINGNPLSSSYVGQLMKRSFKKAIGTATANPRKMTSTMVAYDSDQVRKQTAALMTHSSRTQEKSYTHLTLIENNAKVTRLLAKRRENEAQKSREEEEMKSKEKEMEKEKEDEKEEETNDEELEVKTETEEICTPTESSGARFLYTSAEQDLLAKEFTDYISSDKFPSRPSIRMRISNKESLKDLAQKVDGSSSQGFPRLVQKVINMWRKIHKRH